MAKSKTRTRTKSKPRIEALRTASASTSARPIAAAIPNVAAGPVLRALRSVIYQVGDLARAKAFYGTLLGRTPYFEQPYYVGYDVDGEELGLHPDVSRIPPGPGGTIAYWRVDDLYSSWEFALSNGAEPIEPPHNVGVGTDVAIVADPFGNYIGLIEIAR